MRRLQRGLAAALLAFTTFAYSAVLQGVAVGLADGDTIPVLDSNRTQHKIRLAGIDDPDKRQPFGTRSKESLSAMVFRRQVSVELKKTDRYGRIIGTVLVGGVDVCLEQVKHGTAWPGPTKPTSGSSFPITAEHTLPLKTKLGEVA